LALGFESGTILAISGKGRIGVYHADHVARKSGGGNLVFVAGQSTVTEIKKSAEKISEIVTCFLNHKEREDLEGSEAGQQGVSRNGRNPAALRDLFLCGL